MTEGSFRWGRIQEIFSAALGLSEHERNALMERECAEDHGLRREVASLLAAHDQTRPVDRPAPDVLSPAPQPTRTQADVEPGRVVSHYVVLDVLGAGGMGVVCRARDERLHRVIALKFLAAHLVTNAAAKGRFMQEARAAAALEHPNICTIYEVGETSEGHLFIAMPLYDGETLHTRVRRGPLPIDQALAITREIAAGLAAAHQHGIVHRDVKPSNIMLLPDGRLKVLDFGVAKVQNVTMTASGTPIGTVAFMSPEQTRGEKIDHRTDVWSLGIVLYEMLTGRLPFAADTSTGLMYAIGAKPHRPPSELRASVPHALDDFVATALAKTPERRFPSMADAITALDVLTSGPRSRRHVDMPPTAGTAEIRDDSTAAPSPERRRATVVMTQLSDYASLLERLDPADVEEIVAGVRAASVDTVGRHGGLVNQALGEEIVSLFGIPATHEDDDMRAVRAALELHARVRAVTTPALERTGLRVMVQTGIDSGSLVAQRLREGPRRYGVSGAPVQVAARLASLAGPDAILISAECQRRVRPFFATEPSRPFEIQPDAAPIVPHRVLGESGVHTRLDASDRSSLAPLTGREAELATLESALADARSGNGRIVLVVGDAGMGKSRMLLELRAGVRSTNVRLLLGRCRASGGVSPYLPIVEFLRDILEAGQEEEAPQLVARIRRLDASLDPFIPFYLHMLSVRSDAFPVPQHLQGEHLHAAMLEAVVALAIVASQHSTLLLLLEDWQWADDASREVLARIAEIVDSLAMAIVVATRPDPSILAELGSRGTIIQIGPLDRAATGVLLQTLLGADRVGDDLVARLHDRTGGNPFFLEQVALTLREQGAIVTERGEARLTRDIESLSLPDTVQAVIRARLDRLDGDAREVMRLASVVGREFGRTLLAAAVPREIDMPRALERLRAAALIQQVRVVPEPAYRFKHILTQEVAYASLLEHQRKTAHGAIGRALEQEAAGRFDDYAEQLAHHFGQGESWDAALKYGRLAAARLRELSQFPQALVMFERLYAWAGHLPDDESRGNLVADILLEQERLCETLGQRTRQQQIITELISALAPRGASARLAEAYLRQGDLLTLLKRFDAADRALSTVVRLSRDSGDQALERRALRSVGLLRWHQGRHLEALDVAEKTLALNRALGDESGVLGDLANIGSILRGLGDYDRARGILEEALAMPAADRDPPGVASVLHILANVHRASGNTMLALECLQRADDAMRVSMMPIQRSFHLTALANIRRQLGDVEGAIQTYAQAIELSRRARHAEGLAQALRLLGDVQFATEQDAEAVASLGEAAAIFAQLEDHATEAEALTEAAAARERLGLWTEARETWAVVHRLRQKLADRPGELDALEGLARTARRVSDPDEAIQVFESALALAAEAGTASRQATLHNTLGILQWERGRYFDALGHYESGLRLCRETADRAHEGLMLNSMGVTLARLERHEEARTVLEESVALNRETGERLLEAHALTALGDVSVRLGRLEAAAECLEAALALRRDLGDNQGVDATVRRLGELRTDRAITPSS